MRAYIDESGDPGTRGSGSRWLALGCVMLADGAAPAVEAAVRRARDIIGGPSLPNLHFKKLHHDDKVGALNLVAAEPWTGVVVANDKGASPRNEAFTDPRLLYNHTAQFLIERISDYARLLREPAAIYFEDTHAFLVDDFRDYVNSLIRQNSRRIDSRFIRPYLIRTLTKGESPALDLADGVAYSAFRALERHRKWGHYETAYLNILLPKLLRGRSNGQLVGQGLVLLPTASVNSIREEYGWIP